MSPDTKLLIDKSRRSLDAARALSADGYAEFAASRAYYSMLYAAQALLAEAGLAYSSHAAVLGAFGREFAKTGKLDAVHHRRLIDAQDLRQVGDYDTAQHVSTEQAVEVCGWAEELIVAVTAYLGD